MSFLNKLQKALGFTYEDDPIDNEATSTTSTPPHHSQPAGEKPREINQPAVNDTMKADQQPTPSTDTTTHHVNTDMARIFAGVVAMLNRELPPYLRQGVNEEAQQQFLFNSLDESLKDYLNQLAKIEHDKAMRFREAERDKLRRTFDETREKLKSTEEHLAKESEKAMSAERQKRALVTRVRDLEAKVASLEAEKEQYDLENRSLLNKLRVAEVTSQMNPATTATADDGRNEELQKQLEAAQQQVEKMEQQHLLDNENIASLKENIDKLEKQHHLDSETIASLNENIEQLKHQVETTRSEAEKAAVDLRSSNEALQQQCNKLTDQCATLTEQCSTLTAQKAQITSLLEESTQKCSVLENEKRQLINELNMLDEKNNTEALDTLTQTLGQTQTETTPQPSYEFISFDDAETETPATPASNSDEKKTSKNRKTRKEEKDRMLTDTDWLVEAASQGENPDRIVSDQTLPQNNTNNNNSEPDGYPSQMSLW